MNWIHISVLLLSFVYSAHCQVTPELNIVVHYPPTVDAGKRLILTDAGDSLEMECTVEKMPEGTSVQWQFYPQNSSSVVPISDGYQSHDQNKYKVERGQEAENAYRLTVTALVKFDSGKYQCIAVYNKDANPVDESYDVQVFVKPYISSTKSSTDTVVKAGDNVNLECSAGGDPKPEVIWRRAGGKTLPMGGEYHSNHMMTIEDMKPEYRGHYICVARNKVGEATLEINVDMKFRPVIEVRESEAYQKPGYVKDLICSVSGNPLPRANQISWAKDGNPVDNEIDPDRIFVKFAQGKSVAETRLSIRPVRESDFGTYTCAAVNTEGAGASGTIKLSPSQIATPSRTGIVVAGSGCQATFTAVTLTTVVMTTLVAMLHRMLF